MKNVAVCCICETSVQRIKFEENGRKIIFINNKTRPYKKVQVDGCAITDGMRCDHLLVSADEQEEHFVELKGKDIKHAVEQIESTIDMIGEYDSRRHSYIICTNVATALNTFIQRKMKTFRSQYNSTLVIKQNKHEVTLL